MKENNQGKEILKLIQDNYNIIKMHTNYNSYSAI